MRQIEQKWQSKWASHTPASNPEGSRVYLLDMLPYTSGQLHVGHARLYTIGDALTRYRERLGYRVLHPIGWDAFGLPTDIAAERLGIRRDGSPEISTCGPEYDRVTQRLAVRLSEADSAPRLAPFNGLLVIGMVLHKGVKMSKSRGNVVDAACVLDEVRADVLRLGLLFAAPAEAEVRWEDVTFRGMRRLVQRVLRLPQLLSARVRRPAANGGADLTATYAGQRQPAADRALLHKTQRCVREVTQALETTYAFNVAIAAIAGLVNAIYHTIGNGVSATALGHASCTVALLLAPFAPHAAEELWHQLGGAYSVHAQPWPQTTPDEGSRGEQRPAGMGIPALHNGEQRELPVQIDGKLAARIVATGDMDADEVRRRALAAISHRLNGREIVRVVVVPGKIVNVVTRTRHGRNQTL